MKTGRPFTPSNPLVGELMLLWLVGLVPTVTDPGRQTWVRRRCAIFLPFQEGGLPTTLEIVDLASDSQIQLVLTNDSGDQEAAPPARFRSR